MRIESLVKKLFCGLDVIVDDLRENQQEDDLLKSLRDIKHRAHKTLRPTMGNAEGWPWISEYMIFHVFRRTIERVIGSEFKAKRLTEKSYIFEDSKEEFKLGHSIPLKQLLNGSSDWLQKKKPDICLVHRNRIVLTVEVKTTVKRKKDFMQELKKLTRIQKEQSWKNPRSRAFFVSYAPTLKVEVDEDVVRAYREFYKVKGRYVGRFDDKSSLNDNELFRERDNRDNRMKLLRLEDCLEKIEELLGKLR